VEVSAKSISFVNAMQHSSSLLDKEPVLSRPPLVVDLNVPNAAYILRVARRHKRVRGEDGIFHPLTA